NDPRQIMADPHARYFGVELEDNSLVAGPKARLGRIRFDDWLRQHPPQKMSA
ncbi:NmrA family transcriptional regulator, partial [Rhizobium phaseoli]